MNAAERLRTALSGGVPDRVPAVPKIWVDLAARLLGEDLIRVIEEPLLAMRVIARAAAQVGADGARQFLFPPRRLEREDNAVYEIDARGRRLGSIDMAGGLQTQLTDPKTFDLADPVWMGPYHYWHAEEPFVSSLDDVARIYVTPKEYYQQAGYGDYQKTVLEEVGEDLALVGDCSSATLAFVVAMRGMTRAMYDLLERPELVHAMMEKGVAIAAEKGKFNIDLGLGILRINDSVANMSVISPDHWRQFVFPHLRDLCAELHAYDPQTLLYCHICGNILPVVEDLVATGLDCIAPLDPLGGFSCREIREKVGTRVSLMGGVDTQSFVREEPAAVEEEARLCISQAGENGGFVLGSGCVIPRTAPRENLESLRRVCDGHGLYSEGRLKPS